MENELFTNAEFAALKKEGIVVTEKEKISYVASVTLAGETFDATDVLVTCRAVRDDDVVITNTRMGNVLIKLGVITSLGSNRWYSGASAGSNFDEFVAMLESKIKALPNYKKLEWA